MAGTLQLLFRYRPGRRPDIERLVTSLQQIWSGNGLAITCSAGAAAELTSPLLESVSVNGCAGGAIGNHRRLFELSSGLVSPDQLVVFVVKSITDGGLVSGCAVHPPGIPGLVITEAAVAGKTTGTGRWVLAHELAHVLGLSHVTSTGSLMCDPATSIAATVPALSLEERQRVVNSPCLGRAGGRPGAPPIARLPARGTPEREIGARELPILEGRRRTLLDDLD